MMVVHGRDTPDKLCALCGKTTLCLDVQVRSLDETATSVAYCSVCGTVGSAMVGYGARRSSETILRRTRGEAMIVKNTSPVSVLPASTPPEEIVRTGWVAVYSRRILRKALKAMKSRGSSSRCQRYTAKAVGCGRTATAIVGKRTVVLRGWEYSRGTEAVYVSKGSIRSGVLLELESVHTTTPRGNSPCATSQPAPFKTHCMYLDPPTPHSGCVVGDLSYDNEELTRLLIPILTPVSEIYEELQRILLSLYGDTNGSVRIHLGGIASIAGMVSPTVVNTVRYLHNPRLLLVHGDMHTRLALEEMYPDSGLPVGRATVTLHPNHQLLREYKPLTLIALLSDDHVVAMVTDQYGVVISHVVPMMHLESSAAMFCTRVGGIKYVDGALMQGVLPPLCNSRMRQDMLMAYGVYSKYMGTRYIGIPSLTVVSALVEELIRMSVYSEVALVLVGSHDWQQVERYARTGPVVCVSSIARSSVVPLESLERMGMEPRVRITTRHSSNIRSLDKGLHIMSAKRATAMLGSEMTTPILCVDTGTVPWTQPDYAEGVSVVRTHADLTDSSGYSCRYLSLSRNYSLRTTYKHCVMCKGWALSAMPWVLET